MTGLSIYNQKTQEFEFRPGPDHRPGRARRRDQPGDAQDPVGAARVHGGAPGDDRRRHLPDARPVPRHRHPEPDRVRGHLRAARGPARPLHAADPPRLPAAARGDRHPRRAEARPSARRPARSCCASRSCARCRRPSARSTSTRRSASTSSASSTRTRTHPDVYLGASPRGSIALYRAGQALRRPARPRLRHPRRHQDPRRARAGPPAHHQDELVDPRRRAGERRPRAARRRCPSTPRRGRRHRRPAPTRPARLGAASAGRPAVRTGPMLRRLPLADRRRRSSSSPRSATGAAVPLLPGLPRRSSCIGGSYLVTRLGLSDLEAGYAVSQLPRPRRRAAPGHLHPAQREPPAEARGSRSTTRRRCRCGLPGPGDLARAARRALVARPRCRSPGAATSGSTRSRSGPATRSASSRRRASVGQGVTVVVYPRVEPLPLLAAAGGEPRGQPRHARADAPDDAARDDGPAVRAGRRLQPDPLAVDGPPRRDPGQGVRPRADGRRLDLPRPRQRAVQAGRGDESTVEVAVRVAAADRRPGDRREPGRRADRQRPPPRPSCRPTAAPASTRRSCSCSPPSTATAATPLVEALVAGLGAAAPRDDGDRHHAVDRSRLGPAARLAPRRAASAASSSWLDAGGLRAAARRARAGSRETGASTPTRRRSATAQRIAAPSATRSRSTTSGRRRSARPRPRARRSSDDAATAVAASRTPASSSAHRARPRAGRRLRPPRRCMAAHRRLVDRRRRAGCSGRDR